MFSDNQRMNVGRWVAYHMLSHSAAAGLSGPAAMIGNEHHNPTPRLALCHTAMVVYAPEATDSRKFLMDIIKLSTTVAECIHTYRLTNVTHWCVTIDRSWCVPYRYMEQYRLNFYHLPASRSTAHSGESPAYFFHNA